jgi:hypothetical protein
MLLVQLKMICGNGPLGTSEVVRPARFILGVYSARRCDVLKDAELPLQTGKKKAI